MATYTNLNLARLADGALQAFVKEMAPLRAFSTSFSPESVGRLTGNVVLVPLIGALVATTFGGTYAVSGGTKTVITVTINRHKVVHVGQTDIDALNNSDSSLDTFGFQLGAALGQTVIEDILTLVTTSNFASVGTVASTAMDVTHLRKGRLELNKAKAPKAPRAALIEAVGMDALLAVTNFVQAHMFADNQVLKEGRIFRALGFDFHEVLDAFTGTASVLAFFAHASAIAVAMRYVEPQKPSAYEEARGYSDPKTGLTFGLRDFYDAATGTRYLSIEANYGYSVGITQGGRILGRTD